MKFLSQVITLFVLFLNVSFAETPTISLADPALGNKQYVPQPTVGTSPLGTGYDPSKNTWAVGEPIDVSKMTYGGGCGVDFDCHVKKIGVIFHDALVQLFAWFIELFLYFSFIAFEASYKFSVNIIEHYNIVQNMQEAFSLIPSRYTAILIYIAIPQLVSACITALITVFFFRRVFARFGG